VRRRTRRWRRVRGWWRAARGWRAYLLSVLLLGGSALAQSPPADSGSRAVHVIDLAHPSFAQHVVLTGGDARTFDFVQIRIVHIVNPRHIGVLFEVAFLPDGGSRVLLGSFSLYPPDNPGHFIVAAQHRVRSSGSIVVSLLTVQPVDASTPLAIGIGSVELIRSR
jgi:hypothetical protein